MEFAPPPECARCRNPMDEVKMEAVFAPPAPTMYLSTWSCSCKGTGKQTPKPGKK